jgi:tetratricopeptide (TPR) repeat protein
MDFRLGSAAFILVFAVYLFLGGMGVTDRDNPQARDGAYNLLVRGFLSGHLYLDKEVPPGLAALVDPYDPEANRAVRMDPRYRLHDLSYYRGRLYLYFGAAPALLLFLPWHLLTGAWLVNWAAVVALCTAGLLLLLLLLHQVRRQILPGGPPWLAAAGVLTLGLASYAPLLVARADTWEIPIAFSHVAVAAALGCLWVALGETAHPARWLALASAAFGAAFAARPTALPNAAILLLAFALPRIRQSPRAWAAAAGPLAACGAAVASYNALRFGSALDFGIVHQLAGAEVSKLRTFSPAYLATNLRLYLFQGVQWSSVFPFAHEAPLWPLRARLPAGHGGVEHISGALRYAPFLWAAAAVPALLHRYPHNTRLRLLCLAAAWVAASSLVTLSFFFGACSRYQFEFVPALAFLAAVGVLALEGLPDARGRILARCLWVPALAVSAAFPVLYGIERCVLDHNYSGMTYLTEGDRADADREFAVARSLSPRNPLSRLGAALELALEGRSAEADAALTALVREFPDNAKAHLVFGNVLAGEHRRDEAVAQWREAHRLDPEDPVANAALAPAPAGPP